MSFALVTAWAVRTLLLLLWIPITILAGLARLVRDLDKWSSALIIDHKLTSPDARTHLRLSHARATMADIAQ